MINRVCLDFSGIPLLGGVARSDGVVYITLGKQGDGSSAFERHKAEEPSPCFPKQRGKNMVCPKCQQELISGAQFCNICGYTIPVYSAPEGFTLDEESGLYYQIVSGIDHYGQSGEYVTWFYPNSGEYVQNFNLVENAPKPDIVGSGVPSPIEQTYTPSSVEVMPEAPIEYIIPPEEYPHMNAAQYPVPPTPNPVSFTIPPVPPTPIIPPNPIVPPKSKRAIWMTAIPIASFIICAALAFFIYGGSNEKPEIKDHVPEVQADAGVQATPSPSPTPDPTPTPTPEIVIDLPIILFDRMDHEPYNPGDTVLITIHNITEEMIKAKAFVAIYEHGAAHDDYGQWFYVNHPSEAFPFDAPRREGTYEIRLYSRGDIYNDETLMMSAVFEVVGSSSDFMLNHEILNLIGQPNSVLKEINGINDCRVYTDGMISETFHADYLGAMVRFPFNFQLAPDNTDITGIFLESEMAADEAGRPYFGNSWPDHWIIHGIEVWEEPYYHGMDKLLQTNVALNRHMIEVFIAAGLDGFIDFIPQYEQHQRDFGMDIWQAFFYYEDYIVYAIFETYSGDDMLMCLQIFRR